MIGHPKTILPLVIAIGLAAGSAWAQTSTQTEQWHGFEKTDFRIAERNAYTIAPKVTAEGTPWVWRARFPNYHFEMDVQLLEKGYHIAYIDVAGMLGDSNSMEIWDAFHEHLTREKGFSKKAVLEGVSRGGLFVYNWAIRNPDKVACIYCDTPVLDFKSWPAGKGDGLGHDATWENCLKVYAMTEEEALAYTGNPVDQAEKIAQSNLPILHIVSETDQVVPPNENTYLLKERLATFGSPMQVISVEQGTQKSNGHHFTHPDQTRVVEFIVKHTQRVPARLKLLSDANQVIFLGDSLTYGGGHVAMFETWLQTQPLEDFPQVINVGLPSETVSGLSEKGHAGGRFPRPDLDERLDRVLKETKPDLVFACYGINCGIYQDFDEERFQAYQNGIENLREKVESIGAKIVWVTPPIFDQQSAKRESNYDDVMDRYSQWLVSKRRDGWQVIDLHSAMAREVGLRREADPEFTFQRDGVHTNEAGEWFMASRMIEWFGDGAAHNADSLSAMLRRANLPTELYGKVKTRMSILRDAYLTKSKHVRPGIKVGLPVEEAIQQAATLTEEIDTMAGR